MDEDAEAWVPEGVRRWGVVVVELGPALGLGVDSGP